MRYGGVMDIDALIAMLREPGEDGLPEGIYDDLSASVASIRDGGAAALAEKEAVIVALNDEVQRLKAHNYELLMSVSGTSAETDAEPDDEDIDESEPSLEDIFTNGDDD